MERGDYEHRSNSINAVGFHLRFPMGKASEHEASKRVVVGRSWILSSGALVWGYDERGIILQMSVRLFFKGGN